MANELKHKTVGTELSQAEYEAIGAHVLDAQATDDLIVATSATQLSRLAVAASRIIGKKASGTVSALTAAELLTIINVAAGADVTGSNAPQEHGDDKHTNVTREVFLTALQSYLISSSGATLLGFYGVIEAVANTTFQCLFTMKVPLDFVSYTKIEMVWASPAASGNARIKTNAAWAAAGEVGNTHTVAGGYQPPATGGANFINITDATIALANLAVGDVLGFEFIWNAAHANDTLDDVSKVLGIIFTYVANQ